MLLASKHEIITYLILFLLSSLGSQALVLDETHVRRIVTRKTKDKRYTYTNNGAMVLLAGPVFCFGNSFNVDKF